MAFFIVLSIMTIARERQPTDAGRTTGGGHHPCIVDASRATHALYLFSYLWEASDTFNPLHFGPELKKTIR